MECNYCYLDVGTDMVAHRECELEMLRRLKTHACVRCGTNPAVPNRVRCGSCAVDSKFSGFTKPLDHA